jgi:hypothetical protein
VLLRGIPLVWAIGPPTRLPQGASTRPEDGPFAAAVVVEAVLVVAVVVIQWSWHADAIRALGLAFVSMQMATPSHKIRVVTCLGRQHNIAPHSFTLSQRQRAASMSSV